MLFIGILMSCLLQLPTTVTEKCTPPAQQGFPYTFNSSLENVNVDNGTVLQWQIKTPTLSTFYSLWRCRVGKPECELLIDIPWLRTSANITQFGNEYQRSYFTIHNVSTSFDGFSIQWSVPDIIYRRCDLEVFDFVSNPSCVEPYLDNKGSTDYPDIHVTVNCSIDNVYPVPLCEFLGHGNGQITEQNVSLSNGDSGFYDGQCTLTMPVSDLVPKEYEFQVFMYPNISNGRHYGKNAISPVMDLSLPNPTCETPSLTNNNNDLTVTCGITSVFTGFTCIFYLQTNAIGDFELVGPQSQSTFSSCSDSLSLMCDIQCTLTVSVSQLGVGVHRFQVSMSTLSLGYTTDSDPSDIISRLWYPNPKIVNCPNGEVGFIKQGITATCECELLEPGNPPGKAQWMLSDTSVVGNAVDATRSILSVTYDPRDQNPQLYYCQGSTPFPLENGPRKTFSPKFAYGPEGITEFNITDIYDMCPPLNAMPITCNIDKTTVNPRPEVVIQIPGVNDLAPVSTPDTPEMYSFHFFFTPRSGQQQLGITCRAYNSRFPELSAVTYKEISVREPPTTVPIMSVNDQSPINNGQVVNVTSGQSVHVHCHVQGGVPPVTKKTIKCGGRQKVSEGIQTSLNMVIDKTDNNGVCTCTAEHPSRCYDKSTEFTFNVYFGPDNVKATVNAAVFKLCPSKREQFKMYCDVPISEVNPKPTVVVEGVGQVIQPFNQTEISGNYRFHFWLLPRHGGVLTALCVAYNPMIPSVKVEDDTVATVLEPPSSPPSMSVDSLSNISNGQTVNVTNGQPVQVQCDVQGGFPEVTKVFMTCAGVYVETVDRQLTQNITLDKNNDNDRMCSCSALHSSGCYDLSTSFTFNVQYASEVTNYTIQTPTQRLVVADDTNTDTSDSSQVEVDVGTLVTFVCEGRGNPRPEVKVKSQRSITPIPSQLTPSESYSSKAVASKTMTCGDTAFYVCEALNGIGTADNRSVLVLVKCTPQVAGSYDDPLTYSFINGANVEVKFEILGHPDPIRYWLTKKMSDTKGPSAMDFGIHPDRFKVTFQRVDEVLGEITLTMYALTDTDDGHYELGIQNGIGHGLIYRFDATIHGEGENSDNVGAIVGGIIAGLVIAAAIVLVIIIFLRKKGKPVRRERDSMYENDKSGFKVPDVRKKKQASDKHQKTEVPMSSYEDIDCLPNRTQYDGHPNRSHYEEIDLPVPVDAGVVNSEDFNECKAKTGYENVDIIENNVSKEYDNQRSLGQRQPSSGVYEHAYNSLQHDTNDTADSPSELTDQRQTAYERMDPSASTSVRKQAAYVNVVMTPQDAGKTFDIQN